MEKSKCPKCNGKGGYIDHRWNDPTYEPSFDYPNVVQCDVCYGNGKRPNSLPLSITSKNYW